MKPFKYLSVFLLIVILSTPLYAVDTNSAASTLPPGKHALILVSGGYGVPARDIYISGLFELLNKRGFTRRDIHLEYLNLDRYSEEDDRKKLAFMLKQRYSDLDIDLVFCLLQPALNFLLHEIPEIAPNAPVLSWLATMPEGAETGGRHFVFQSTKLDYRGTLQRALELFPDTERVIVIQGNSEEEKARKEAIWSDLAPWKGKLNIADTQALTAEEIEALLASVSKNTIIMGVGIVQDAKGEVFVPIEFIQRMLKSAKAPSFVLFDTNIGSGTIGGSVVRVSEEAAMLAALGVDVISGRTALNSEITNLPGVSTPMFDWQQLQRWGAKTAALPNGTIFVNRPVTLWSQYKKESVIALIVFLSLGALTLSLYYMNRRLQESEASYRLLAESVLIDINRLRQSEEELRQSREDQDRAQQVGQIGSWRLDTRKNELTWSDENHRIFGIPKGTPLTYETFLNVVHPDDRQYVDTMWQAGLRGEPYDIEHRLRVEGQVKWVREKAYLEFDDTGKLMGGFGITQDITDRKQIEEVQSYLLQISSHSTGEEFFESLARYLATILGMDYVCIDTLHGDCLSARTLAIYNDGRFEDNLEYTLKDTPCGDVVGKEVCVFPREVRNLFPQDAALQDLQAESYVGTTLWSFDMKPIGLIAVIGRKELNSSHFAETVLKLVSIRAAGELERRKAEEEKALLEQQFQHTQKLESLGVLAGGIAHDFNNILAIIMGYCSLTRMDYESAEKNIEEIEKAAERAAGLCRQMLAYAGKAQLSKTKVDMSILTDEMVSMLKTTLPLNTAIKPELSTNVPMIEGDASQLRQVVMNLIINASEAIGKEQGEIKVSLATTKVTAGDLNSDYHGKPIPLGEYACLEVTDNGCGIDDETKWRIFEPFYTTKFTGRGLGMSAVLGIINSHGGALQLFSQPGEGTTFKVYLPALANDSAGEELKTAVSAAPWNGSGTILLAEDEDQVRFLAKKMLDMFGFTVLEAINGKEALEMYQKNASDITLVMTDMGMPVMDGYELFRELKKLNPKLPIIISSGFGDVEVSSQIACDDHAGLISKPYSPDQLRDVVKRTLEGDLSAVES